jgi:hypothetical protein
MDQTDGTANLNISKRREPAWLKSVLMFNPPPDRLDYEYVRESRKYGIASRTQAPRFTSDKSQYWIQHLRLV